jgi:hypothetical protein
MYNEIFKACLQKVSDGQNVPCNQDDLIGLDYYTWPKAVIWIIMDLFTRNSQGRDDFPY